MISQKFHKIWRVINMAMLLAGLFTPWVDIGWETTPAIVYGWQRFFWASYSGGFGVLDFLKYGLDIIAVSDFLIGLGGVFLVYYFVYNILAIRNIYKRNRFFSVIFLTLITIVLFDAFSGFNAIFFSGLWIFVFGLFSCAIIEWQPQYSINLKRSIIHPS